jgi:hypothetical protein
MKRHLLILFAVALFLGFLTACSSPAGLFVTGTLSADDWALTSPLTVTVSNGVDTFSTTVTVANSGVPSAPQAAAFVLGGVPAGTYTVTIAADNASGNDMTDAGYPAISVNEGALVEADSWTNVWNGTDYSLEATFGGISIGEDTSIDIDLGSGWVS